ncbi:MAG: hypothetical protein HY866_01515 [Chloroflexi bacterium]|nr:hypothetical protein [Chloroflexota bacterium]
MEQFDKDYLDRREKEIQELYSLRAMSWACAITGGVLAFIAAGLMNNGRDGLGSVLLVISLLFGAGSIFIFADYFSRKAADRAIQKERTELLELYQHTLEKPKRSAQDNAIRLSDDGELVMEDDQEIQAARRG